MSGYFARLAELVQAPAASAMQEPAPSAFHPLEQDIEVDAAPVAATTLASAGASGRFPIQDQNASKLELGPVRSNPTDVPATQSAEAVVPSTSDSSAAPRPSSLAAQAMPVSPEPVDWADSSVVGAQESMPPGFLPMTKVQSQAESRFAHTASVPVVRETFNSSCTTDPQTLVTPLPGTAQTSQTSRLDTVNRIQAASNGTTLHTQEIWREASIPQRESFVAPMSAGASKKASPRAEVRIGTITLEVRTSPSPSVVTAPAPAATAPPMATQQFSPRRHYLRWN